MRRSYAGKRAAKARKRLKQFQAMARVATSNYAVEMLIEFIACQTVETARWKREADYYSMVIRQYRS